MFGIVFLLGSVGVNGVRGEIIATTTWGQFYADVGQNYTQPDPAVTSYDWMERTHDYFWYIDTTPSYDIMGAYIHITGLKNTYQWMPWAESDKLWFSLLNVVPNTATGWTDGATTGGWSRIYTRDYDKSTNHVLQWPGAVQIYVQPNLASATDITIDISGYINAYLEDSNRSFAVGFDPDCHWIWQDMSVEVTPVPIPAAVWLLGAGLVGLVGIRRRLKK